MTEAGWQPETTPSREKMKDASKVYLEAHRPKISALEGVDFVLNALYKDAKKSLSDNVVDGCTYEELIGALLRAKDELEFND